MSHQRSFLRPPTMVSPASAKPNHFLKIILPEAIHAKKMRIPKEFVRRFENELSNDEAAISVPDGLVWKMELKKYSANEVWFCNGWQEFVKYYSLTFGFFLLFKHESNSRFSVIIFDMSASEIYYPCKNNNSEEQNSSESESSGKRSILDQFAGYNRRSKVPKLEYVAEVERSKRACCSKIKNTLKRKQRDIEAVLNFKTANPSFTLRVTSSNMTYRYMDVPASFCRTYMKKINSMKLQDCNGREWAINYAIRQNNCSAIRIQTGLMGFMKANNVKEGDVCLFELINRTKNIVFKVTTFAKSC